MQAHQFSTCWTQSDYEKGWILRKLMHYMGPINNKNNKENLISSIKK